MHSCRYSADDLHGRRHGDVTPNRAAQRTPVANASRSSSAAHIHAIRPAQEWVAPSATSNQIFTSGLESVGSYENLRLRTMKTDAATS